MEGYYCCSFFTTNIKAFSFLNILLCTVSCCALDYHEEVELFMNCTINSSVGIYHSSAFLALLIDQLLTNKNIWSFPSMWHFDSEKNTWLILFFFPSFYFCPVRLNMLLNMVQQVSSYSPTLLTMPLRMTWGCTQTPGTSLAQGYSEGPFTSPWGLGETPFPRGTPLTVSIHFHPPPPPLLSTKTEQSENLIGSLQTILHEAVSHSSAPVPSKFSSG